MYLCGASLIAPQVVLTAGHCVNNTETDKLVIRCGEWDTQTQQEELPHQERKVFQVLVIRSVRGGQSTRDLITAPLQRHAELDVENHHNNFALLFLSDKFDIMDHISPICLPQPNSPPSASEFCVSHGWGKDKFGSSGR